LASGLSAASVLQAHRVLSRALKVAMQRGTRRAERLRPRGRAQRRQRRSAAAHVGGGATGALVAAGGVTAPAGR
jgi:hypothetical protein